MVSNFIFRKNKIVVFIFAAFFFAPISNALAHKGSGSGNNKHGSTSKVERTPGGWCHRHRNSGNRVFIGGTNCDYTSR